MDARDQARRVRRDGELDEVRPAQRQQAGRALAALQRSAGNRSLSARLARDPDTSQTDDAPKTQSGGGVVTMPGIGAVPVTSVRFGETPRPVGGSGGGSRGGGSALKEMSFTSSAGEHSAKLLKANAEGTAMAVEVDLATVHFKLGGAVVSSYSVSGSGETPTEMWSLGFESSERTGP
jgi:hypothetical protein